MSSFSASNLARTGWDALTAPRRLHAQLDREEGIGRAVFYFFVCAAVATAIDLFLLGVQQGAPAVVHALLLAAVRFVLSMGVVPFILGGILYGVCWIAGSKARIETGVHVAAYAIGSVLPPAAVLSYHPTHGVQSAAAALAYGLLVVVIEARLAWGGRPDVGEGSTSEPSGASVATAPDPQPAP